MKHIIDKNVQKGLGGGAEIKNYDSRESSTHYKAASLELAPAILDLSMFD